MDTVNVLLRTDLSFCFILGGKTNQLNLQNTATKAIIQGLMPDQNYTVQIIAYNKDKESKPVQGQFRSTYFQNRVLPWDSVPGLSLSYSSGGGRGPSTDLHGESQLLWGSARGRPEHDGVTLPAHCAERREVPRSGLRVSRGDTRS